MRTIIYTFKAALVSAVVLTGISTQAQDTATDPIKTSTVQIDQPLEKIAEMQPQVVEFKPNTFKYITNKKGVKFIVAPDGVQAKYPELVAEKKITYMYGKNAYRTASFKVIDEDKLAQVMLAAVKEQQSEINQLKAEIDALKKSK